MHNYCTLFDSNYLTRGLALHSSLVKVKELFTLYILCFDILTFDILDKMNLPRVVLISLENFETEDLKRVKRERTRGEYCWTCTPHIIRYILDYYNLPEVTYLDSDVYFFSKPSILFEEFEEVGASILITEHRYTPKYDRSETSGTYCVQFITFKSNQKGLTALRWWQDRCLEWCYNRYEEGKFGDQKYLDDWTKRFEGVHVLEYAGGGVAPWNVQQYKVMESPSINGLPIVFYHFHDLLWYEGDKFDLSSYSLTKNTINYIYKPYLEEILAQLKKVKSVQPGFDKGKKDFQISWKTPLYMMERLLKGTYNVIQK